MEAQAGSSFFNKGKSDSAAYDNRRENFVYCTSARYLFAEMTLLNVHYTVPDATRGPSVHNL